VSGRDHAGGKLLLLLLRHQQSEGGAGARRRGGGRNKGQATHTQGASTAQLANLRSTCGRSQEPRKCEMCTQCSEYTGGDKSGDLAAQQHPHPCTDGDGAYCRCASAFNGLQLWLERRAVTAQVTPPEPPSLSKALLLSWRRLDLWEPAPREMQHRKLMTSRGWTSVMFWMKASRLSLRAQSHWNLHSGVSSRLLLDLVLGVANDVATTRNIAAVSPPLAVPPLKLYNGGLWTPAAGTTSRNGSVQRNDMQLAGTVQSVCMRACACDRGCDAFDAGGFRRRLTASC